jgi:hypothetical protein
MDRRGRRSGISEARRALNLRKGAPTDDDRPPPSVFPGKKNRPIPGQLDLFGGEHGTRPPETA